MGLSGKSYLQGSYSVCNYTAKISLSLSLSRLSLTASLTCHAAFYGKPPPDEQRFRVLDRAHDLGATFWDTADVYGDNEDLIRRWFERSGKRDEVGVSLYSCFGVYVGLSPTFRLTSPSRLSLSLLSIL